MVRVRAALVVTPGVIISPTHRAATKVAVIRVARATHMVGRLGGDAEIETLIVEEDANHGPRLGYVEGFHLDPNLLLLSERELVHDHHLAEDLGHVPDHPFRAGESGRLPTRIHVMSNTATTMGS
ncbi:hypothetical protein D1007_10230 [Hordeum vulgare]|nr:hypothetical protein D1007_10230 [Hordeum vulgare]